jgi:hypothetical protein
MNNEEVFLYGREKKTLAFARVFKGDAGRSPA